MLLGRLIGEGEIVLALVSYGFTTKALLIIYITALNGKGEKPFFIRWLPSFINANMTETVDIL
ncbi:hypothetical protein GCM10008027_27300 [Pseudoalteromonas gelatinilytica]|uniref:Uncharacterized protein n=1 Tax=Pseudoalteromonas gelatinilytica TaxID=1703256 RepID=A0ABQ1TR91_9GAMM|nr:hypothetical protein GCM10008027_27300 [Pseudoalteromonas profundi]